MRYFGLYIPPYFFLQSNSINTCISKLPCQWFKKIKIETTFRIFFNFMFILTGTLEF